MSVSGYGLAHLQQLRSTEESAIHYNLTDAAMARWHKSYANYAGLAQLTLTQSGD